METINASQCKRLDRLELHCARLRALVLQHCASLVAPTAFACPALSEELNVNGCASLTASALERMSRAAPKLASRSSKRVRVDGGELSIASRALEEVSAEGCARLTGIRIAAPLRILEAKACKSLASAWIEPPPGRGRSDEEEGEAFGDTTTRTKRQAASRVRTRDGYAWTCVTVPRWYDWWGCERRRSRDAWRWISRGAPRSRRARGRKK